MVARRVGASHARAPWLIVGLAAATPVGCSGKPRSDEPAPAVVHGDARPSDAPPADAAHGTGDLQVRVEWADVPVAARSSPGRTPCNTPRSAAVAPTTTWGVPDALVIVDGASAAPGEARLTLADCAFSARIVVGSTLALTSAVDRPAKLALRKRGPITALVDGDPRAVWLPTAGHTVVATLDPGAIYAVQTDAPEPEVAFVAPIAGAYVTEANGQITVHGLAAGPHAVTAWLPPRAGQPARIGHATATITGDDLVELTVKLTP